jgi:hypothetical protein
MPRVYEAKAAKDYPAHGIKKGETYYHWSFFRSPKQMSKTRPRQSQITGSPSLASAYAAQEAFEDALGAATTYDEVLSAVQDAAGDTGPIDDFEDKISNLEEAFQGGCPALEEAEEQRDTFQSWLDELDSAASEIEGLDDDDFKDEDDPAEAKLAAAKEIAENVSLDL